jgi:hypothetical protein
MIILVPLLFWLTNEYGALGASFVWLGVSAGVLLISMPIMHQRFMPGQLWIWYKKDIALPFVVAGSLCLAAKLIQSSFIPNPNVFYLGLILIICGVFYALLIPDIRLLSNRLKTRNLV